MNQLRKWRIPHAALGEFFKAAVTGNTPGITLAHDQREKLLVDVEWSWLMADFYSLMNQKDEAFFWLEHAVGKGFINYPLFHTYDPFLDNMRVDKRFDALMLEVKRHYDEFQFHGILRDGYIPDFSIQ